jgi:flagellar protein FliS
MNHTQNASSAMQAYQTVGADAAVAYATPYQLIQMLYEAVQARIAAAKGHVQRQQMAEKGALVGKAISIIAGLRHALNKEAGGEIASNLDALYDYMERRLLEASAENSVDKLEEVYGLIGEIKAAWLAIGPQVNAKPASMP